MENDDYSPTEEILKKIPFGIYVSHLDNSQLLSEVAPDKKRYHIDFQRETLTIHPHSQETPH